MSQYTLYLPDTLKKEIWDHLLGSETDDEEVVFVFASQSENKGQIDFRPIEWYAVPPEKFAVRSPYYVELTDDMRGYVIKRAHDLDACIIELHSHTGHLPAQFSESDLSGFREWVPHVLWRLDDQPYIAVVVAQSSFDGIVWRGEVDEPQRLDAIVLGEAESLTPTHLSNLETQSYD